MARLLGLDPGLRFTGWGLIEASGNRLRHIADGVVATDAAQSVPERLKFLHDGLMALLELHRPDEAAVEETYVNRNGASTLKLGYARAVSLLAPALFGIPVAEYAAKSVKSAVVGTGNADKDQVGMMVRRLLPGASIGRADAADALAVAICHAHHRATRQAWGIGAGGNRIVIALLTGKIEAIESDRCIVDVAGVGYLVFASTRTLDQLGAAGGQARVLIETQVREDAISLYGFWDAAERDWFRLLTTVQGVGARLALNILSALSPRDLIAAINAGDRGSLTRANGVGAKLAIRLLTELRDKAGAMPAGPGFTPVLPQAPQGPAADAVSALINLGYRRPEAQAALDRVQARLGRDEPLDRLIREGLRELAQ